MTAPGNHAATFNVGDSVDHSDLRLSLREKTKPVLKLTPKSKSTYFAEISLKSISFHLLIYQINQFNRRCTTNINIFQVG